MDIDLTKVKDLAKQHKLTPIVPITNNQNMPYCTWSNEKYWTKSVDEINNKMFKWENRKGETKRGKITGFGLLTGVRSGITIIDLDVDHKKDVNGVENFNKLINELPEDDKKIINSTFIVGTPRGGKHLYFKYVEGIKNDSNIVDEYPGIDARNDGGQAPIPYSQRKIDNKILEYKILNNNEIQQMPQSLINKLKNNITRKIDKFELMDEDIFLPLKGMVEGDGRNVALNEALFKHCTKHNIRDITTIRLIALAVNEKYFGEPEEGFLKTADSVYRAVNDRDNDFSPISEYSGCYFKSIRNGSIPISNFIIKPIRFIECIDDTKKSILEAVIITQENEKIYKEYRATDFDNVQTFDKVTCDFRTRYTGNVQDLKYIKTMVFNQVEKRIRGVNCGGMHLINREWYFVDTNGCINSKGEVIEDIVLINKDGISCELTKYDPITSEDLKKISKDLFSFNSPQITFNIIGYISSLFLKEKLRFIGIKYNHLFYSGEAGAGKSDTLENIIIPILCINNSVQSADGCTKFAMEKVASSNNTIPYIIDEFKPGMIAQNRIKAISNMMRDVYDWHISTRGKEDLSLSNIQLVSPIILSGEASTVETAIIERSLLLTFSKKESKLENRTNSYNNIKNIKELKNLGRGILETSLNINLEELKNMYDYCNSLIIKEIKVDRVRNTAILILLGIEIIKKLFESLGLIFEEEINFTKDNITQIINNNIIQENLDNGNSTKSIVDLTIEKINDMFMLGYRYLPYTGYKLCRIDDGVLSIQLKIIYDYFSKYIKDFAIEGNWLAWNDFNKQLQKTDYYVGHNIAVRFPSVNPLGKCDKDKISKAFKLNIISLKDKNISIENIIDNAKDDDSN